MSHRPEHVEPADLVAPAEQLPSRIINQITVARHASRCSVCRHPQRAEIEALYLGWADPNKLETAFGLPSAALRRHAAVYEHDVERARRAPAAAAVMLEKAIRHMRPEDLTPQLALDLLRELRALANDRRKGSGSEGVIPPKLGDGDSMTWEQSVRLERGIPEPGGAS